MYLLSVEDILSESSIQSADTTRPVPDGTMLQWDSERTRISTVGFGMWWDPHVLVEEMLTNGGADLTKEIVGSDSLIDLLLDWVARW